MILILLLIFPRRDQDWDQEQEREKARIACAIRAFQNFYPADAVKADIPFPFGNGRTTVARASDFQLRHVIFPKCNQASWSMKYRFGNHTCNLEHRRVKWLRVLG